MAGTKGEAEQRAAELQEQRGFERFLAHAERTPDPQIRLRGLDPYGVVEIVAAEDPSLECLPSVKLSAQNMACLGWSDVSRDSSDQVFFAVGKRSLHRTSFLSQEADAHLERSKAISKAHSGFKKRLVNT